MYRTTVLVLCLLLALAGTAAAEPGKPAAKRSTVKGSASREAPAREPAAAEQAKELSGMSIVGNDEAPKSLYIVPWKSSEIGVETGMNMLLNESAAPVDREVFMRQLEFYELSTKK